MSSLEKVNHCPAYSCHRVKVVELPPKDQGPIGSTKMIKSHLKLEPVSSGPMYGGRESVYGGNREPATLHNARNGSLTG